MYDDIKVTLLEYPKEQDWMEVKRRALITVGLSPVNAPDKEWREAILRARHSPIRRLFFSFLIENLPSCVSVHLCRHIHAQPYVRSQRNDRQNVYDRYMAPQDAPVSMIWDMNAEELLTVCNKRLCGQADAVTRQVVKMMRDAVLEVCPEFRSEMVPACVRQGGNCYEMHPCGRDLSEFMEGVAASEEVMRAVMAGIVKSFRHETPEQQRERRLQSYMSKMQED